MTKIKKLHQTLDVSGTMYNKDFIDKNSNDVILRSYIKTSEYPSYNNNTNEDSTYRLRYGPEGFYLMDGAKFDKILKNYLVKDHSIRENTLKELKKKYPILYKQKKTQRLVIGPLEKRFIWDLGIYNQLIKEMCEKGKFCDTKLMNDIENYIEGHGVRYTNFNYEKNNQIVYVNYDDEKYAKDIFICSDKFNHINNLEKIIDKISSGQTKGTIKKTLGTIKITNKKMNFFAPKDFDKTEAQQRDRYSTPSPEKFVERSVKCSNGEYEVHLFIDEICNENKIIVKKYEEEILSKSDPNNSNYQDWSYNKYLKKDGLFRKKNPIKEIGSYIYYIKFT